MLSSAAAACESSLGNKVLQILKFFFQGMWIFFYFYEYDTSLTLVNDLAKGNLQGLSLVLYYNQTTNSEITNLDFHEFLDHLE